MKNIIDTDIDIDVVDRESALKIFPNNFVIASQAKKDGTLEKHNSGIYFQNIPKNAITNVSTINYKEAKELGYFKVDILTNTAYNNVSSIEELTMLINKEPTWELLEYKEIVEKLFHINNHYDIVQKIKPKSVEDLAIVLALIRPSKRYLLDKGIETIKENIWTKNDNDAYHFKKSHAISYALVIVMQLNKLELMCE